MTIAKDFLKACNEGQGDEAKMTKAAIEWLKRVQKNIPKAIKALEKGDAGGHTSDFPGETIGMLIRTTDEEWYDYFFG